MASRARQGISIPGQIAGKLDNWPDLRPSRSKWVFRSRSRHPSRSKSVDRGRSRRPRSVELVRGCRLKAARSVRRCAEVTKIDTKLRPGATNARGRTHCSSANHRRGDLSTNWVDFWRRRHACEPSKVPRLPAKTKVRHIALHNELLTRCYLEKRRKSNAKSVQSRSRRVIWGTSRRPSRSKLVVRGQSKRQSRSKWVDRGQASRVGTSSWHARA